MQRSRHGSGSSLRSRRSNSIGEKTLSRDVTHDSSTDVAADSSRDSEDAEWHQTVKASFLREYIEYICESGFIRVSVRASVKPRRRSASSTNDRSCS